MGWGPHREEPLDVPIDLMRDMGANGLKNVGYIPVSTCIVLTGISNDRGDVQVVMQKRSKGALDGV